MMVTAERIARALGGQRCGAGWTARCPAHQDRMPSLSITARGGRVLVHCHAGCGQREVIAALRVRGLWPGRWRGRLRAVRSPDAQRTAGAVEAPAPSARPLAIWEESISAEGTAVAAYLASRGLVLPQTSALRFHPGLRHPQGRYWPAIVALVTRGSDGAALAIHRTFLATDGQGKAPVKPDRMMLGPCRGGAVRLAPAGETLMVGEGIETCLSVMQAAGLPAWAALSTSGMRGLDLPDAVRDVIVLADGDEAGEAAARDCASRWMRQGRVVRIARPPEGSDFNDVLLGRTGLSETST